ncbi:hypothetical protein ABZP36_032052 [Zizania latifolia]
MVGVGGRRPEEDGEVEEGEAAGGLGQPRRRSNSFSGAFQMRHLLEMCLLMQYCTLQHLYCWLCRIVSNGFYKSDDVHRSDYYLA